MDITSFPSDIFLLIIDRLNPADLITCRRVSKHFQATFTETSLNRHALQHHYPRARRLHGISRIKLKTLEDTNWPETFAQVAARYHYLQAGKPRSIETVALGKSFVVPTWSRHFPVAPWQQLLSFEEKEAPFHYQDPLWTYDEGLLVYPAASLRRYALYDLAFCSLSILAFEPNGKIVRRIRLKGKVLVFEWCEDEPHHQLNDTESVHRHFATAYDLILNHITTRWETRFRNEWMVHSLGMPLNSTDRFISTHSDTHYAVYLWQPNRSASGEDDPIESLEIWDISSPSSYVPPKAPSVDAKLADKNQGPKVIRHLSSSDLSFYNIRQKSTPIIRSLELDESHVYFVEEDHRWLVGPQASHNLPRLHKVKSTGIPLFIGPRWEDECGADGDLDLSFCERNTETEHPRQAPCWRHSEFPYLTITEVLDRQAGVSFSARHCFMLETISINIKPKVHLSGPGYETSLQDNMWSQLLAKGKICGDERWLIGENSEQQLVICYFDRKPR